jgi:hypothetical protein
MTNIIHENAETSTGCVWAPTEGDTSVLCRGRQAFLKRHELSSTTKICGTDNDFNRPSGTRASLHRPRPFVPWPEGPWPKGKGAGSPGFQPWAFYTICRWEVRLVRSSWRPHSLTRCNHRSPWKHRSTVRTEHRLEAYATLTPSRRRASCEGHWKREFLRLGAKCDKVP